MNYKHKSLKLLISGSSGTGKTTYWLRFIHKCPHAVKFIYDSEGEFIERGRHGIACKTRNELIRTAESVFRGEAKSNQVIYDPAVEYPGASEIGFEWFCGWVFEVAERTDHVPKILCCDELQNMADSKFQLGNNLKKVLETGRRYSLDFVGITQALNLINNRIRNQITELVSFRTQDIRALDFLESRGFDPSEIMELRDLHFVARDMRTNEESRGRLSPWQSKVIRVQEPEADIIELADFFPDFGIADGAVEG